MLLYSFDCSAHEKVVQTLAGFLIETCNCNVHLDVFEEQIIHERGLDDWLVDKLQEVEFIIVLSSIGARLRCSKKKVRFKVDPCHTLPDYFAVAVDYVAEKMRVERAKGMPLTTFCVVYMDYSSENDIPPQLEMGYKFCLMKDITALFCHLHGLDGQPTKNGEPIEGLSEDTFDATELGQELKVAIESAKEFFRSNPDWVEDRIEPVSNVGKFKSRHTRKSSLEPLLGPNVKENMPPSDDHNRVDSDRIRCQTLPKIDQRFQQIPLVPLQNRQNSFPSSLSSRQTISTPPLQKNSKSCDNFSSETNIQYEMSGMEGNNVASEESKATLYMSLHHETETEDNVRSKSKSMPAVFRNSLHSSQTIFIAEVHKEWDYQDGQISHSDSQETSSNADSVVDDLERDLDSIVNPKHIPPITYSHTSFDNISNVFSNLPAALLTCSNLGAKSMNPANGQFVENTHETNQSYEDAKMSLSFRDCVQVDMQNDIQLVELKF